MKRIFLGIITFMMLVVNTPISAMDNERTVIPISFPATYSERDKDWELVKHALWLRRNKFKREAIRFFRTAALSEFNDVKSSAEKELSQMRSQGCDVDGPIRLVRYVDKRYYRKITDI